MFSLMTCQSKAAAHVKAYLYNLLVLSMKTQNSWNTKLRHIKKKKKILNLPSLACDRTGVLDRAAAIIASSVLKDVGIISSNHLSHVIDRSKLRRERTKVRSTLQETDCNKYLRGIYFNLRKDKTLFRIEREGKFYRKRIIEDHYVIL